MELLAKAALPKDVPAGGPLDSRIDLGDACLVTLPQPAEALLVTADLLFPVSEDGRLFGAVAGVHALSDVYAALGEPLFACVTLGGDESILSSEYASSALRGLSEMLTDAGAVVGGGHTVVTSEVFLNVAITGRASAIYNPQPPARADRVLLSKPLGTGLALTARRMELASEADIEPEYEQMTTSNHAAAEGLKKALTLEPGSVRAITDVSGFGLLGALQVVGGGSKIKLFAEALPITSNAERFIQAQAWSALADANLRDSQVFTRYEEGPENKVAPIAVNDPQTSGGLLAIVEEETAKNLVAEPGYDFTDIGVVQEVGEKLEVVLSRDKGV